MSEYKEFKGKTIQFIGTEELPNGKKIIKIRLDGGETITFGMEGGGGLDSNWYEWLVMRVDGNIAERL